MSRKNVDCEKQNTITEMHFKLNTFTACLVWYLKNNSNNEKYYNFMHDNSQNYAFNFTVQ